VNIKDNSNLDLWTMLKKELAPYTVQCTKIHLHHFNYRSNGGKFMLYDKHIIVTGTPDNWRTEFLTDVNGRLEEFDFYDRLTDNELILKLKELALQLSTTDKQKTYAKHLLLR
jgi:hypothetical protein